MTKAYKVAVLGATGLVGREILKILEERGFPVATLVPLASERSAGTQVPFAGRDVTVQAVGPDSFRGIDLVLMSAGGEASRAWAPVAAQAGCVVIDNSSCWRSDPDVPLVVPEVNSGDVAGYKKRRIIANPNCSTIQLVVALAPLHAQNPIQRLVIATYQAVSGKGKQGLDELGEQVMALYNHKDIVPRAFAKRIAFNCLPHIDVFLDDGYTKEEHKMCDETRKILHAPSLGVCATCVRVPVFNGHAVSVVAEFRDPIDAAQARLWLREAKGVLLQDDPAQQIYPTPIDADGQDMTLVGRVRRDPSHPHGLALWCVADNLRKGAATNAVQIAEILARDHLAD